ncbi:hypothetical protein D3C76_1124950 [compost metagenome]
MDNRIIEPLGRRFFWVKSTGNIIAQRSEMTEGVESTKEEDFEVYIELQGYNPEAIEMTTFEYEQYKESFLSAKHWRFNPETAEIEFSYHDPNVPEPEVPVYQKPLTEQIKVLEAQNSELMLAVAELDNTNESDKMETQLAIAELASMITGGVA